MTDAEKLSMLQTLLADGGETPSSSTLSVYLQIAEKEILNWKYHLVGGTPDDAVSVPAAEEMKQVYAVLSGYTHAGAEGQSTHTENGIVRTFKYSDMLDYIHNNVKPFVRVW